MSKAEPRWKRHCRFLAALNDDNVSLAWTLLCGREGPPVDPDIRIMTGGEYKPAICIAVERDLLEMAELLIMRGCSVNQFAPTGLSPLHIAVMRNNIAMVHLLLKSGASVSCRDSSGRTPLHHLAVCNYSDGSLEIAKLLVQKGSKTEHRDGSGATPLALACQGHRDLALYLLSLGANAGAADNEGDTPLHHACTKLPNDEELVMQLLAAGVRVSVLFTVTCYDVQLIVPPISVNGWFFVFFRLTLHVCLTVLVMVCTSAYLPALSNFMRSLVTWACF